MAVFGKAEHRFPCIDDEHNNRFVEINDENKEQFESSWDVLLAEDAEQIYPAHGKPFRMNDLSKYKNVISKIHLYPRNG